MGRYNIKKEKKMSYYYFDKDGNPTTNLDKIVTEAIELQNYIESLKKKLQKSKEKLIEICEKEEVKEFDYGQYHINYIEATLRKTFNSKKFKSEHPDEYEKYIEEKPVAPSIRFRKKKEENK